jgi:hypothetical protein
MLSIIPNSRKVSNASLVTSPCSKSNLIFLNIGYISEFIPFNKFHSEKLIDAKLDRRSLIYGTLKCHYNAIGRNCEHIPLFNLCFIYFKSIDEDVQSE